MQVLRLGLGPELRVDLGVDVCAGADPRLRVLLDLDVPLLLLLVVVLLDVHLVLQQLVVVEVVLLLPLLRILILFSYGIRANHPRHTHIVGAWPRQDGVFFLACRGGGLVCIHTLCLGCGPIRGRRGFPHLFEVGVICPWPQGRVLADFMLLLDVLLLLLNEFLLEYFCLTVNVECLFLLRHRVL